MPRQIINISIIEMSCIMITQHRYILNLHLEKAGRVCYDYTQRPNEWWPEI